MSPVAERGPAPHPPPDRRRRQRVAATAAPTRRDALRPDARVIALDENVGFGRANNLGVRRTSGELVLLLNSDTIVPPGAIDALVAALRETPEAAIAGPRLVDADGRPELSFGRMVDPFNERRQQQLTRLLAAEGLDAVLERAGLPADRGVSRLGLGRVPPRVARRGGGGGPARRALLHVPRGRRLLRRRARIRASHPLRAADRGHAPRRSVATSGARPTQLAYRRSHVAFYEKHHPRWAPLLRALLRLKGELPDAAVRRRRAPSAANSVARSGCRAVAEGTPPVTSARACASASTPESFTTSGLAPTCRTCCVISRASTRVGVRPVLPARGSRVGRRARARTSARSSTRAAAVFDSRAGDAAAAAAARARRPLPQPALRAAAARAVPVGGDDPRLHPPDVPAVPAEPPGAVLRAALHVVGGAPLVAGDDGVGGVEARHPALLPASGPTR